MVEILGLHVIVGKSNFFHCYCFYLELFEVLNFLSWRIF